MIRKKIQYYISKIRTCYLIETGFSQTFKNLQMIVLYNNKNKVFDLCYDKFFNK
jgi:phosphoglycerate-specific signal transduction histidine kinase